MNLITPILIAFMTFAGSPAPAQECTVVSRSVNIAQETFAGPGGSGGTLTVQWFRSERPCEPRRQQNNNG